MASKTGSKAPQAQPHRGRGRKETLVAGFVEKVAKSKGLVFTNYQGLTHVQLEGIKKAVKKVDAEYVITKNTLMLRSLGNKKLSDEDKKNFQKPTATLFMYNDIVDPIKQLAKTIKEFKLPLIKFGIIDGKTTSADDITRLSTLPTLLQLRAQLLGQMKGPITGLHRALQWNLQTLVMTLKAIESKKQPAS